MKPINLLIDHSDFLADDELGTATGYHNALPLEVHGSGYTQMHMISNSKAEKLVSFCSAAYSREIFNR